MRPGSQPKPNVSIPSRGSGKGDSSGVNDMPEGNEEFQSPLGEVVKETQNCTIQNKVNEGFNPLSGKW